MRARWMTSFLICLASGCQLTSSSTADAAVDAILSIDSSTDTAEPPDLARILVDANDNDLTAIDLSTKDQLAPDLSIDTAKTPDFSMPDAYSRDAKECVSGFDTREIQLALDEKFDWVKEKVYLQVSASEPDDPPGFAPQLFTLGGGSGSGKLSATILTSNCDRALHLFIKGTLPDPAIGFCQRAFDSRSDAKVILYPPNKVSTRTCEIPEPKAVP